MRTLCLTLAVLLLVVTLPASATARQIIGAEQDHSLIPTGDCDSFYRTTFTSFASQVHEQEQREIDLTGVSQLVVRASAEGGVSIRGWNRPSARLIVCRYAGAETKTQALRALAAISISHARGEIEAFGPPADQSQSWWVNMILYVPRRATVDVHATNGGIAIRNMEGRITAHATSGGISVAQSSGRYAITTDSGGITLDRVRGSIDATSRSGAIALKLEATAVPPIEARTADSGHILCQLKGCDNTAGSWAANRQQLRIGKGAPEIRLSNASAPITIGVIN